MIDVKYKTFPSKKYPSLEYVCKEVYVDGKFVGVILTNNTIPDDLEDCKTHYSFSNENHLTDIYFENKKGEKIYPVVLSDFDVETFVSMIPNDLWVLDEYDPIFGWGLLGNNISLRRRRRK